MRIRNLALAAFAVLGGLSACANQPVSPQAAPVLNNNTNVAVNVGGQQCCESTTQPAPAVQYAPPPAPPVYVPRPPQPRIFHAPVKGAEPCPTCVIEVAANYKECVTTRDGRIVWVYTTRVGTFETSVEQRHPSHLLRLQPIGPGRFKPVGWMPQRST